MFGRHATGDEIGMRKMGKFYKEEKDMITLVKGDTILSIGTRLWRS